MDEATGRCEPVILPEDMVTVHDWLDTQAAHRADLHNRAAAALRMLPWAVAPPALAAIGQWWLAITQPTVARSSGPSERSHRVKAAGRTFTRWLFH
jgi:hypothetical protein